MYDRLFEVDALRNIALDDAETYDNVFIGGNSFEMLGKVKDVCDKMPLFTTAVAEKIASRQNELAKRAQIESAVGKIASLEKDAASSTIEAKIKTSKSMKKDTLYDTDPLILHPSPPILPF